MRESQQACLGSNAFELASHMVQGSLFFTGTESDYCKCSSSVLLSMMSFDLQHCTRNEWQLSVNRNCVYSCLLFKISQLTTVSTIINSRLFFQ